MAEANGLYGEKGGWNTEDSSYQANATQTSPRKSPPNHTRTQLSNGVVYLSHTSAAGAKADQIFPNSESDSLLNLYGDSSTSNVNLPPSRPEDHVPNNLYRPEDHDADVEKWIHRDKLARIENEELQAAGFHLAKQTSQRARRTQSRDRLGEAGRTDQYDQWAATPDEKRPRVLSSGNAEAGSPENQEWDLRTPEEIAATSSARAARIYATPVVRKSGSKIPVLSSSPLPITPEQLERDTPLPRRRTYSGSVQDDDMHASPRPRTRGNSSASQNLLDQIDPNTSTPATEYTVRSGTKLTTANFPTTSTPSNKASIMPTASLAGAARKTTPAGPRKTSNAHKPRVPSNSSNNASPQPPGARSADPERPRTAVNRPEGEAPWIATMYKPDPRLPPDQQIIPTHAKKQQQQQQEDQSQQLPPPPPSPPSPPPQQQQHAEKDTAIRGPYDPGSSPSPHERDLEEKTAPFKQPSPSPPAAPGAAGGVDKTESPHHIWPLKQIASATSTASNSHNNGRPGTSGSGTGTGTGTGGYRTMPKVASSPLNSPPPAAAAAAAPLPPPTVSTAVWSAPQNARQPVPPEIDKKKEKSCGICVVM